MAPITGTLAIRPVAGRELLDGAAMLADALGFGERDAIPAWHMRDTVECGGLALGAFAGGRLVGFSWAFPGVGDDGPYLFSCGLAVSPQQRSRGIGRRLKLAQRRAALERGYRLIRWTADPLAAPALRLYLSGLGARLVGYRAGLYDGLRAGGPVPHDDVEVVWPLVEPRPGGQAGPAPSEAEVEIPRDRSRLSTGEELGWRLEVRAAMMALLGDGYEGVGVRVEPSGGRCWVCFRPGAS